MTQHSTGGSNAKDLFVVITTASTLQVLASMSKLWARGHKKQTKVPQNKHLKRTEMFEQQKNVFTTPTTCRTQKLHNSFRVPACNNNNLHVRICFNYKKFYLKTC